MSDADRSMLGKKFGYLTVIDHDHGTYWWCRCDCGEEKSIRKNHLTSGRIKSCGCRAHPIDRSVLGKRFGRLTVIDHDHGTYWLCECDCGNTRVVRRDQLLSGFTISCDACFREGARERATTHGLSKHPIYKSWDCMKRRCEYPNAVNYGQYGGRGITICDEWKDFETFYDWSINNGYKPGLSIDRIDTNGDYKPENCRWTDRVTQANNKTNSLRVNFGGETHTVAEWSRILDVPYHRLRRHVLSDDMHDFEEYFGLK